MYEEHVTLLSEPNSQYLGHISLANGAAKCISGGIVQYLKEKKVAVDSVRVVGCDGTSVNTGHKGGVMRLLEEHFERPLQWFVCLLHMSCLYVT